MVKTFVNETGQRKKFIGDLRSVFEFAIYAASRFLNNDRKATSYGWQRKHKEARERVKEFR